jgi:hypothetical protein
MASDDRARSLHDTGRNGEAFKKTYPGIRIILDQGSNSDMVKSVEDHRNELAVIRHKPSNSRPKIKVIWTDEVVLIRDSYSLSAKISTRFQ